jgi:hypothetical protein
MLDDLISTLIGSLDFSDARKRRRAERREASGWGPPPKSRAVRIAATVAWGAVVALLAVYLGRRFGWK